MPKLRAHFAGKEHIHGRATGPIHTSELIAARKHQGELAKRVWVPHKVFPKAHPVVKWIFERLNEKKITLAEIEKTSGVPRGTLLHWRSGHSQSPEIWNVEAVVSALGGALRAELLPMPEDLAPVNPPGHSLPDKPLTYVNGLPNPTPHAIRGHGARAPTGAAPKK